jgi:enterochelin esterase-like enzyme
LVRAKKPTFNVQNSVMKILKIIFLFSVSILLFACKSSIKQKTDSIYSRHLQRQIPLTIISTDLPNKKEDMNLLLFNNNNMLEAVRAKIIIDSLYKNKLIQPLMLVAFDGLETDYGLEEMEGKEAKEYKQYNSFIDDELYPFVKKKATIRKFNSVAICGFMNAAKTMFDVAYNDDNKFQMVGMFSPKFNEIKKGNTKTELEIIQGMKKKLTLKIFLEINSNDTTASQFETIILNKPSIILNKIAHNNNTDSNIKKTPTIQNFAAFLLWAFPE